MLPPRAQRGEGRALLGMVPLPPGRQDPRFQSSAERLLITLSAYAEFTGQAERAGLLVTAANSGRSRGLQ